MSVGLISLGGGLPSASTFPLERLSAKIPNPPGFTEEKTKESGVWTTIGKYDMTEGTGEYGMSSVESVVLWERGF